MDGMSAEEGRDYRLVWPKGCVDWGGHDVLLHEAMESYAPIGASCTRCGAQAQVQKRDWEPRDVTSCHDTYTRYEWPSPQ